MIAVCLLAVSSPCGETSIRSSAQIRASEASNFVTPAKIGNSRIEDEIILSKALIIFSDVDSTSVCSNNERICGRRDAVIESAKTGEA